MIDSSVSLCYHVMLSPDSSHWTKIGKDEESWMQTSVEMYPVIIHY